MYCRYFCTNKLYNSVCEVKLIHRSNLFRELPVNKPSLSHTCSKASSQGSSWINKEQETTKFSLTQRSPGRRPKSSMIPFLLCMLYVSKTAENERKKPRVWTPYRATKWNKMADRQLQQSSCWDSSANQRGVARLHRIHFADIGFAVSRPGAHWDVNWHNNASEEHPKSQTAPRCLVFLTEGFFFFWNSTLLTVAVLTIWDWEDGTNETNDHTFYIVSMHMHMFALTQKRTLLMY